jgi:stringent starvation protein B
MTSPPRRLPPKKDVMIELLARSGVFLHIDPRREGVSVPVQFRKQAELVLQVGLNMAVPIRDLEVDDDGVSCTLSFNRSPFWCRMPWGSVFAIVSDEDRRGVVWPEDVPPESKLSNAAPPAPKRPKLRAVTDADAEPPPASSRRPGPELSGEGTCGVCKTRWVEDQDACPICGAGRAEAFRPEGAPAESPPAEPAAPSEPVVAEPDAARAAPAIAPAPKPASVPPSEAPPAGEGGEKPKRQLPPYLRIVK